MPVRRLPLKGTFRLGRFGDIWHKPALSAVIALAVPDLTLLALGRLDLAAYTSPGPGDISRARGLLTAALVELREAAEVAAGEWWQRALPEERIAGAEQRGHRTLARLAGPVRDRVCCGSTDG
ncbi:hypothetical protein GCM10023075_11470 [Streptosporangium album]